MAKHVFLIVVDVPEAISTEEDEEGIRSMLDDAFDNAAFLKDGLEWGVRPVEHISLKQGVLVRVEGNPVEFDGKMFDEVVR